MNRTSEKICLTLSDFSAELHRTELEEALQSESLVDLDLHLDGYDGIANLEIFFRVLENAPNEVVLRGGLWENDFVDALNGNKVLQNFGLEDSDVTYMRPVIEQIGSHPTLKSLFFHGESPDGPRSPRNPPSPVTCNVM